MDPSPGDGSNPQQSLKGDSLPHANLRSPTPWAGLEGAETLRAPAVGSAASFCFWQRALVFGQSGSVQGSALMLGVHSPRSSP